MAHSDHAAHAAPLSTIAFVGTYVPRRCGIATFTRDLRCAVAAHLPSGRCLVVALDDAGHTYDYPEEVRFHCDDGERSAFRRAAELFDLANVDVVSLQHEYGIFGGVAGENVLELLRHTRMPVHTTLHTVLAAPSAAQRRVMDEVLHLSARLAVMTQRGRALLRDVYGIDDTRIDVIPHGIPETEFVDPETVKPRFGLQGRKVLLTFGLLSPSKGIEHVIGALPEIVRRHPDVVYLVVGATHPHLLREQGERYREQLSTLAHRLGVGGHVEFHDRYVDMPDLLAFLAATDIYVTPYLNQDQITSGTLAYAFGCGKAVVSTPYWHATELLADGRGVIVPFADAAAIASETSRLLADGEQRDALRQNAYAVGREMTWSRVAARYAEAFRHTRLATAVKPRRPALASSARLPDRPLPPLVLDHLWRLTDSTGLFQHATHDLPNLAEGYCTDDNARAVTLMVVLDGLGMATPRTAAATATYAAFVGHAFVSATGRFRNFLGFDRRWLDDGGSDDCLGRTIVALGTCIGRSSKSSLRRWAMPMFEPAVRAVLATTSPRAWALAILGIQEYLRRLHGDRTVVAIRAELTGRLLDLTRRFATPEWPWFEEIVAYENARPCQALISAGRWTGDTAALDAGLQLLDWLAGVQASPTGRFSPVGCKGFLQRGSNGTRSGALFDQQPLEAQATIAASIEAFHATGDRHWRDRAWNAFDWFRGHNVLGLTLCDPHTGGCRDGLLEDRVNENQGAESTLAWLVALAEMTALEAQPVASTRALVPSAQGSVSCR
jgi:glycosyltransferase involved in cell wall biosynthesis